MRHLCLSGLNSCPNSRSLALAVSTISLRTICRAMPSSSANTLLQLIPSLSFCIAQREKTPRAGTDVSGDYPYWSSSRLHLNHLSQKQARQRCVRLGRRLCQLRQERQRARISMLIVGGNYDSASTLQLSAQL